jgi:hypothetical protein
VPKLVENITPGLPMLIRRIKYNLTIKLINMNQKTQDEYIKRN